MSEPIDGSSPRGRGTPTQRSCLARQRRFIPARAGNTPRLHAGEARQPVHPRAGGEHFNASEMAAIKAGSSPRGRGTPHFPPRWWGGRRFIPARAGNTVPILLSIGLGTVHPRAGGEHSVRALRPCLDPGSSPRGRGTRTGRPYPRPATAVHPRAGGEHIRERFPLKSPAGSSPRGRGTPHARHGVKREHRFIPARAGNTRRVQACICSRTVHPRAGGEHFAVSSMALPASGSSPRGRGTLVFRMNAGRQVRFIPARAGNTQAVMTLRVTIPVHPRAGGEHSSSAVRNAWRTGSSPRGRGTLGCADGIAYVVRFIPARAGNTTGRRRTACRPPVHPRAGGEHCAASSIHFLIAGSSPRGRGTRPPSIGPAQTTRFIPARAGNTSPP